MTPEQRQELLRLLEKGEELSPEWARILFPPEKREYELVYQGKDREEDIIANALAVPFQPVRTFGRNGGDWQNMLIFCDNLQGMKTLVEMKKAGRLCNADGTPGVRVVYIDPPFATKQDFEGTEDQKAYQDRIAGADFLEFLRKRLIFLRELLADKGGIFVHLDQRRSHYVKVLMDEIFGEANFRNELVWRRTSSHNFKTKGFVRTHEQILFYSYDSDYIYNEEFTGYSEEQLKRYRKDENGRLYKAENITFSSANPSRQFEWRGSRPPSNRSWGASYEQLEKWWKQGRILKKRDGTPRLDGLKFYLDDMKGNPLTTVWDDIERVGNTAGERVDYPTQKPEALVDRVLKASSNPGDLVLDAFAGSGTTLAVAEKLGRRWIGMDCGKLAIYTIQKRMLNLRQEIGNKGPRLEAKPFTLYNAGLYDFSVLKELPWQEWRFFALQLFSCRDEPHRIGGIQFDGYRQGQSVMVFNHMEAKHKGACISEETIVEIHEAAGSRVGNKVFIVAPALAFDFQQDYIDLDKVRYYALRIPYSIIHELHRREFTALKQPADEMAVNDTVEAVGFDFIRTPELKYKTGTEKPKGELFAYGFIKIETFKSDAVVREPFKKKGHLETLSMVMLDFDYDENGKVLDLDEVHYADAIAKDGWKIRFRIDQLGKRIMAVFMDIYGNEARVLIDATEFGTAAKKKGGKRK